MKFLFLAAAAAAFKGFKTLIKFLYANPNLDLISGSFRAHFDIFWRNINTPCIDNGQSTGSEAEISKISIQRNNKTKTRK